MSATLYEMTGQYLEALDFLTDPANAVDQQTAVDTMENMDAPIEEKMLNVGRFILEMEHQSEGIKAAIDRMAARKKAIDNRAEWLKGYLKAAMEQTGKTKVSDAYTALALAKNPPHVVIEDEELIPEFFKSMKEVWTIKKADIKEALKAGQECPGARIDDGGFRISIK